MRRSIDPPATVSGRAEVRARRSHDRSRVLGGGTILHASCATSRRPGPPARRARASAARRQVGGTMSESKQLFSTSRAKDAVYKTGLRSFMEYRDLGVESATHGPFRAHVIRIKKDAAGKHELHTTGLHQHLCEFQMFYVLKGWIRFVYEDHGEHTFQAGDCVVQPAGIVHNELDCSDDIELLEVYSPAVHQTVVVDKIRETAAAH